VPSSGSGAPSAAAEAPGSTRGSRLGLVRFVRTGGFRRLLGVRFATQWGDGMFQAALGGAVLFNPERQADPLAVAAGLAVLLLPYSLVGPFAAALIDRWDRRRVLLGASLVRAVLVVVVAAVVLSGGAGLALYLPALAAAGVNRFVLAALSVALPHVVPRQHLVEANTFAVTAGAAVAAVGGASAIGLRELVGTGDAGSGVVTLVGVAGSLTAAVVAAGFRRRQLGPDRTDGRRSTIASVLHGFSDGARATIATPSVAGAFLALGTHRLAFGVSTLLTLLLFRYAFTDAGPLRAGMAGLGEAVVLAAAGLGAAAVVTPWMVRRWGRPRTVRVSLVVATLAQLTLAALLSLPIVMVAAFVLGLTGQVVKLCADAAVQAEVGDEVLGRVFALYDIVFNVGYVLAVACAALLSPPDGAAPWLFGSAAVLYVVGLAGHDLQLRRARRRAAA